MLYSVIFKRKVKIVNFLHGDVRNMIFTATLPIRSTSTVLSTKKLTSLEMDTVKLI